MTELTPKTPRTWFSDDAGNFGGKRRNMPKLKRTQLEGRGPGGKTTVVGVKDRATKKVQAQVVENATSETLQGF